MATSEIDHITAIGSAVRSLGQDVVDTSEQGFSEEDHPMVEIPDYEPSSADSKSDPVKSVTVLTPQRQQQQPVDVGKVEVIDDQPDVKGPMTTSVATAAPQRTEENILDLCAIKCASSEDFNTYYVKFRAGISRHLRKKGDKAGDIVLLNDEIISPTFEEVIVLWCLERIDPDLPKQIKETFGVQLDGSSTLKDLREEIFKIIPIFLGNEIKDDLDEVDVDENGVNMLIKEEEDVGEPHHDAEVKPDDDDNGRDDHDHDDLKQEDDMEMVDGRKKRKTRRERKGKSKSDSSSDTTCNICGNTYRSVKHLLLHQRYHEVESEPCACTECGKTFATRRKLSDHKTVHKVEHCVCDICDMTFNNKTKLKNHRYRLHRDEIKGEGEEEPEKKKARPQVIKAPVQKSEVKPEDLLPPEPASCEICGNTYKSEKHLIIHKRRTHTLEPSTCTICGKTFDTRRKLTDHMTYHKIKYCVCKICDMTFTSKNNLKSHNQNHHMDIECERCGRVFPSKHRFRTHMRKQHGEVPDTKEVFANDPVIKNFNKFGGKLTCNECKEEFINEESYVTHMREVHKKGEGDKLPCEICGKLVFATQMKKHVAKHQEEKVKCETCKRTFPSQEAMGAHICKHYACDQCDLKFIQNRNLQNHKLEHTGKLMYHCDQCEAMFKKLKSLGEHKRFVHRGVRRYTCTLCPRKFAVSSALVNHMRAAHTGEKPFKCAECGQAFRQKSGLNAHTRLHTDEFPFNCDVCQQKFRTLGNLKSHRETKLCGFTDKDLFRNNVEN